MRLLKALALTSAVFAVVVALWELPDSVHRLNNRHAAAAQQDAVERTLPAARVYGLDPQVFVRLRRLIPRHAVYAFVRPTVGATVDALAFPGLAQDYLLPRRETQAWPRADWIIAYHADPHALKVPLRRVLDLGSGVEVGVVAH